MHQVKKIVMGDTVSVYLIHYCNFPSYNNPIWCGVWVLKSLCFQLCVSTSQYISCIYYVHMQFIYAILYIFKCFYVCTCVIIVYLGDLFCAVEPKFCFHHPDWTYWTKYFGLPPNPLKDLEFGARVLVTNNTRSSLLK